MRKYGGFFTVSFLLISSLISAQNTCPQGFSYAGTLSGSDSEEFSETVFLKLPLYATLDESYQQAEVQATKGKRKTQSNLRPQDIPKSIHITPYGSSDHEKVWAVSRPQLIKTNNNGTSNRYAFGIHLFCSVQDSTFGDAEAEGNCDVGVRVCYKPK